MVRLNQRIEECAKIISNHNPERPTVEEMPLKKAKNNSETGIPDATNMQPLFKELDEVYSNLELIADAFSHTKSREDLNELMERNSQEQFKAVPILQKILIEHCSSMMQHIKKNYPRIDVESQNIVVQL